MSAVVLALLAPCAPRPEGDDTAVAAAPTEPESAQLLFRVVVFADPHVSDPDGDHADRLDRAVAWVEAEAEARRIGLVLVVGDIAWDDGLARARAGLDALTVPWVPVNGDNEVALGAEQAYADTFADHYADLAGTLEGWTQGPVEVWNPQFGRTSWYHNLAFELDGVRFVGLDWASRDDSGLMSEFGELHDFEGGTWPFFAARMAEADGAEPGSVVLFGHIPMHFGTFDLAELDRITGETLPREAQVWADLAGHYHADGSEEVPDAGYELHVTDALWDDVVEVRLVELWRDDAGVTARTEVVVVP